jgi:AraC family transcriptional regulator, regulatory protein of adaptative response / DNA-3-methyladenine glycosylase II
MEQPTAKEGTLLEEARLLARILAAVRRNPGEFRTAASLGAFAGLDLPGLARLFLVHGHTTPEAFLQEARVEGACARLLDRFGPPDAAGAVCGFASASEFRAVFHRHTGLTPARYQALGREGGSFVLDLPEDFRIRDVLAYHGRDPESLTERVEGATLVKGMRIRGEDRVLELTLEPGRARVRLPGKPPGPGAMGEVHRRVVRMLGLATDPAPFEGALAFDPAFQALVASRRGLRIPLTADVWESLVWAILGQQVNLAFAATLRRRLTELAGGRAGDLRVHPAPRDVAALEPEELLPLQCSRAKAQCLVEAARDVASGALPLESLTSGAATLAEASLAGRRGIGPWTTHYVLMRGCGFRDCVPLGDAGLTAALQRHHGLDHRPDARETAALMAPFAPHRSLATFHLWASLAGGPV